MRFPLLFLSTVLFSLSSAVAFRCRLAKYLVQRRCGRGRAQVKTASYLVYSEIKAKRPALFSRGETQMVKVNDRGTFIDVKKSLTACTNSNDVSIEVSSQ